MPTKVQLFMRTLDVDKFPSDTRPVNTSNLEELEIDMYKNGMTNPIMLENGPMGWVILDGVRRLTVAKRMKMEYIPVTFSITLEFKHVFEV